MPEHSFRIMFCPSMTDPNGESVHVATVHVEVHDHRPFDPMSDEIIAMLPRFVREKVSDMCGPQSSIFVEDEAPNA